MSFYGLPRYPRPPPSTLHPPRYSRPRGAPIRAPYFRGEPPLGHFPPTSGPRFYPTPFGPPDGHFVRSSHFPPDFGPLGDELDSFAEEEMEEYFPESPAEEQSPSTSSPMVRYMARPQPFDQYICDKEFWPQLTNEEKFSKTLIQRNQQITPNENEQAAITSLVIRVKSALESIAAANILPSVKIDEFREVGSYKKGTMLTRKISADLVVFFKTLPTPETVKQFGDGIVQVLRQSATQPNEIFGVVPRDYGCDIAGTQAVLKIRVAIPADEFHKLTPGLHLKVEALEMNLAALRHALWFDEHAGQPAIKILVRLIKDIKDRCRGLVPLDIWTIELLSHYCVTCTPDKNALPLTHAFRRFFQLLSSGFLLHTSIAVADPCDQTRRLNHGFSLEEADHICRSAQFITRMLMHNQFERLLSPKSTQEASIGTEREVIVNLNIAPLKEAHNKDLMVNEPPNNHFYSRAA